MKKWFILKNKVGEVNKEKRGEIELHIHWRFTMKTKLEAIRRQEALERSTMYQMSQTITQMGRMMDVVEESDEEAENDDVSCAC